MQIGKYRTTPFSLSFILLTLSCGSDGGGSSGSTSVTGSCRGTISSFTICEEYTSSSAAVAANEAECEEPQVWQASACEVDAGVNGCQYAEDGLTYTVWYLEGYTESSLSNLEATCREDGSATWLTKE